MEVGDWANTVIAISHGASAPLDPIAYSLAAFFAAMRGEVDEGRKFFEAAAARVKRVGAPDPQVWSVKIWVAPNPDEMAIAARELQEHGAMVDEPFWILLGEIQECTTYMLQSSNRTSEEERASQIRQTRRVLEAAVESGIPNLTSHISLALGGCLRRSHPDEALDHLERAIELAVAGDAEGSLSSARLQLAALHAARQRPHEALGVLQPMLERHVRSGATRWLLAAAASCARPLLDTGRSELAALVLGTVSAALDARPAARRALIYVDRAALEHDLRGRIGDEATEELLAAGRTCVLEDVARQVIEAVSEVTR
jgi:hypothetical protein